MSAGAQEKPLIQFVSVEKSYGNFRILNGVSFDVRAGEHLALIGPSGSGKTTILRILMTLEKINGGDVEVDGASLVYEQHGAEKRPAGRGYLREKRRPIGMVFQQFNLFPNMDVLQNITLAPVQNGLMPRQAAGGEALALLEMVGLSDKAHQMPANLSGGQKQRVALARALALKPKVLLLDEITSALDPELVEEVLGVVKHVGRETDTTMLLVTHEMSFARDFADRVLFLDKGSIVEEGPPEVLFRDPKNERTKQFLKKIVAAGIRV
ncbi:ectoine/hydroxyectoine ABC transporter ATP-binding protein EhuA [Mesorhizobium australicum]|uniref:ectoine/hydroxyectoine ABC transporter ATP-binding protein EhuA n=1 Tax=Mesorhizobium australicum TaxID=536018 RepID=UPI00333BD1AE